MNDNHTPPKIPTLNEGIDPGVRPQDDLFAHVNGRWLAGATIPSDRSSWGSFDMLRETSEFAVRAIIDEAAEEDDVAAGSDEQLIGDLFQSFMDTETIDQLGTAPLHTIVDRINAATDIRHFVEVLGELGKEGIGGLLGAGVWVDRGDTSRYLVHIEQSGLGLPDESYYHDESYEEVRDGYRKHIATMLELTEVLPEGVSGKDAAAAIMKLETTIADAHWDRTETRDALKTYNLTPADDLRVAFPLVDHWMSGLGAPDSAWAETIVGEPDVVEKSAELLNTVELETWKLWLIWHAVQGTARLLPEPIAQANFDFYGKVLSGTEEMRPRWKRGVSLVEGMIGDLVGRVYVERHYPETSRVQMQGLIDDLLTAYKERIGKLAWMQPETRERALEKLATFSPKIGMPLSWKTYPGLELRADDLVGNVRRASAAETQRQIEKLSKEVDREEWFMTPQTVNAYYNPTMNEIVFPAAILQYPFFDPERDAAYNYGAIGAVIGHEIGHGFDDQGSKYDGEGNLSNWWTDEDREAFEAKVDALVAQYEGLVPRQLESDEHGVNGRLTVGENIGDLGGVTVAYHAFKLHLEEHPEDSGEIDGRTAAQRFFYGWGEAWRWTGKDEEVIRRLTIDPHSPPEFRGNIVKNVAAFHEAFGTKPGDGLWLEPEDRIEIW